MRTNTAVIDPVQRKALADTLAFIHDEYNRYPLHNASQAPHYWHETGQWIKHGARLAAVKIAIRTAQQ